jgi:hypothetical protein
LDIADLSLEWRKKLQPRIQNEYWRTVLDSLTHTVIAHNFVVTSCSVCARAAESTTNYTYLAAADASTSLHGTSVSAA